MHSRCNYDPDFVLSSGGTGKCVMDTEEVDCSGWSRLPASAPAVCGGMLHHMHRLVLWHSVFPLMMLTDPRHIAPGTDCTEDTTEAGVTDDVTEAAEEPTPVCDLNPITVANYNCYEVAEAACNSRSKVREAERCAAHSSNGSTNR